MSNGALVLSEEVDDTRFEFFEKECSAGRAVSNRLVAEEAVRIARSLQHGHFLASVPGGSTISESLCDKQ
ncbi:hypothetical protein HPB50_011250 [Hyalomma asiaticum]|uniref:Uncharacterized protein n=1 Tax=Hyalomma asiaticum TaxID=266040 RepID=A0ACB7SK03_HYAAI|nr:hypothetical protein HPB50_011250 [Hyalomma asiaticum]